MVELTKKEISMFQSLILLAEKHRCLCEFNTENKTVEFMGNIQNELALAKSINSYFGEDRTIDYCFTFT